MAISVVVVLFVLLAIIWDYRFTEGVNYVVLDKPIPNAQNTLIQVFSYDCSFCYNYDKTILPTVVPNLPTGLTFRPFHLKTRGKYGVQANELFAVLLVKDQENGLSDREIYSEKSLLNKAMIAYYHAYHDKKERWDAGSDAFLKTGFDAVGMSKAEFDISKKSQKVKSLLNEWDASYEIGKAKGGVPALVVNGKYVIKSKSLKSVKQMESLIKELSKK